MPNHRNTDPEARARSRTTVEYTVTSVRRRGETILEEFMLGMPERYRQEFGSASIRQHARIVAARGRSPVHAALFSGHCGPGPGLCVVANDTPTSLAVITTGLMLAGFEITRGDAYTRHTPSGRYEAVDLFWLRRSSSDSSVPLCDADVSAFLATLRTLLKSGKPLRNLASTLSGDSSARSDTGDTSDAGDTSVLFRYARAGRSLTLELESCDRPGLIAVVAAALATEGVRILDARIRTHGSHVHDYFELVESDGTRPAGNRVQEIQATVLSAVNGSNHLT
jgi:UTP:GlnB (protein PII) uridylyltransferase